MSNLLWLNVMLFLLKIKSKEKEKVKKVVTLRMPSLVQKPLEIGMIISSVSAKLSKSLTRILPQD